MLFEHRLFAAHKELASKGVKVPNYAPPLYRLLRRTGWQLRPPHYERFMINLLALGLPTGIIWGLLMWFLGREHEVSLEYALRQATFFTLCFGLPMAIFFQIRRLQLKLTPWGALPCSTPKTQKRWQPR